MDDNFLALYKELDEMLLSKDFKKVTDKELKHADCYYIDSKMEKYVFICKVYTHKSDLLEQFDNCQAEDISYLQGNVFANQDIRWDMYFLIFYTGDEGLSFEEYNRIEKDRFFCKKLIISAKTIECMKEELNRKLPVTGSYYNFEGPGNYICHERSFFEIFREKTGLDKKVFTDEYLQNISEKSMEDFIKKLEIEGVK